MANQTPRLTIPYIISSQSQKEITHNMALNMYDALVQPAVETSSLSTPPLSPTEGRLWLVSSPATGDWLGQEDRLAQYIGGAWNFFTAFEGMRLWLKDDAVEARYDGTAWLNGTVTANKVEISGIQVIGAQQSAIADVTGGATIDTEARTALNSLLAACRSHGLIAT